VAREAIPQCVLPEVEVFLGDVPITKYETPGGKTFAETILPFVQKANVIILANHGTVSYGESVERAYWWSEILDSYCRILMLAKQLGHVHYLGHDKARELLELKQKWGWSDPRLTKEYEGCDVCGNAIFRDTWEESGVKQRAFTPPPPENSAHNVGNTSKSSIAGVDLEQLVATITQRVIEALKT
jgi:L-fuculose-phosphate aldolase